MLTLIASVADQANLRDARVKTGCEKTPMQALTPTRKEMINRAAPSPRTAADCVGLTVCPVSPFVSLWIYSPIPIWDSFLVGGNLLTLGRCGQERMLPVWAWVLIGLASYYVMCRVLLAVRAAQRSHTPHTHRRDTTTHLATAKHSTDNTDKPHHTYTTHPTHLHTYTTTPHIYNHTAPAQYTQQPTQQN